MLPYHQPFQPGFPCGEPDMAVEGLCNGQAGMNAKKHGASWCKDATEGRGSKWIFSSSIVVAHPSFHSAGRT